MRVYQTTNPDLAVIAAKVAHTLCPPTGKEYVRDKLEKMTVKGFLKNTDSILFFVDGTLIFEFIKSKNKLDVRFSLYEIVNDLDRNKGREENAFKTVIREFQDYYCVEVVMQDLIPSSMVSLMESSKRKYRLIAAPGQRDFNYLDHIM